MQLLATSAMDAMKQVSPATWFKIAMAVVVVIVGVFVLRKLFGMNKMIMGVIGFVVCSIVFFSWVYNRNEPRFMTPIIERIAPFFPSAGSYQSKQQSPPKH